MSSPAVRREIGTFALLMTGVGSIIGSGWLFGAWRAAGLAGPGAIWAWVLGGAIILTVALTYAELGGMFPEAGGTVRYGYYSHGALVGCMAAWANWISSVSIIPIEAAASIQYMASWDTPWARELFHQLPGGNGELTTSGLVLAALLMVLYWLLNFWSVKLFARSNTAITVFKLIVPALTALALMASGFHRQNFNIGSDGQPYLLDFPAILTAVATAGIVLSFNGFQSPVNLAGDARRPGRAIPLAVLGSVLIATVIYVLLQVAYLGTVPSSMLAKAGWQGIDFSSPFAQLALLVNLHWLATLLYVDAFLSPSGTGLTYTASTARIIQGMQHNKLLPKVFERVHPVYGVPRTAMGLNLIVSFLFLFFFRSWGSLAAVVSIAIILSYLTGPVSAMTLRRTAPDILRPFRLIWLPAMAVLAFIFSTEVLYWAAWPQSGQVILLVCAAFPIYLIQQAGSGRPNMRPHLKGAAWLIVYLPTMALVSWAGSAKFGGRDYLPWGWDLLVVAALGLIFFVWGAASGWQTPTVREAQASHGARD